MGHHAANVRFLESQKAVTEAIAAGEPLETVLNDLVLAIEAQGSGFSCSICVVDGDGASLRPVAAPNVPDSFRDAMAGGVRIGPYAGSCGAAAFHRRAVVVDDVATDPIWSEFRDDALANGIKACWSSPILVDGKVLGTFAMYYPTRRRPTDAEMAWVRAATHIAAIAIDRDRSEETIRRLAFHDHLTGLPNRMQFEELVAEHVNATRGTNRTVAVMFLDLDHFKRINDTAGHRIGDEVLKQVATNLSSCAEPSAVVARIGGDEFVFLLPDVSGREQVRESATRVLGCIRSTIEVGNHTFAPTASMGVSLFPADGDSAEELIEHADQAMYDAKSLGRNQVRFFDDEPAARARDVPSMAKSIEDDGLSPARLSNRVLQMVDCSSPAEFAEEVRRQLAAEFVCVRLVTSTKKLVTLGLSTKSAELGRALDDAIAAGEVGGVMPRQFNEPVPVRTTRVGSLLQRAPGLVPSNAWLENLSIAAGSELIGIVSVLGDPSDSQVLTDDERAALRIWSRLHIVAHREGQRHDQMQAQLRFMTEVSAGLSSTGPIVDRLKRAVVATQDALDFDSIQIITWDPTGDSVLLNALFVKDIGFVADRTWDSMTRKEVYDSIESFRHSPGPQIISDPGTLEAVRPEQREWMRRNNIQFLVFVPLIHEGEQHGTLVLTSRHSRGETEDRLAILTSVGGHLAAILQLSLLLAEVQDSYTKLRRSHMNTVETLAVAAEMRDKTTGEHLRHLRELSQRIGERLGISGVELEDLGFAAVVHDVGKLQLPDRVLLKPGDLNEREWAIVKTHPEAGEALVTTAELPQVSREVVRWHHERWDGSGYPDQLKGEEIPLSAQIVAVADVFDALISKRPYKEAWPVEAALQEIENGRGRLFNPDVADVFLSLDLGELSLRHEAA